VSHVAGCFHRPVATLVTGRGDDGRCVRREREACSRARILRWSRLRRGSSSSHYSAG
jgi:hypothetical protein